MIDPLRALGFACLTREGAAQTHGVDRWHLCETCERHAERCVGELPDDVYDLSQAIARHNAAPDGPAPPGKPGSKPPMNLHIDALRSQIVYTALTWEEVIRDKCKLSPRRRGAVRDGPSITLSTRVLAPRVTVLAGLDYLEGYFDGHEHGVVARRGMDGLRHLCTLHHTTRKALGLTVLTISLPGQCRCGAHMFRRHDGADTVWCDNCEHRITYADYTRQVQLLVDPPQ